MHSYICCKTKSASRGLLSRAVKSGVFNLSCENVGCDPLQKTVAKTVQLVLVVEVAQDLHSSGMPDPDQPAEWGALLRAQKHLKEENPLHEILYRPRRIEITGFSDDDDLRNSGDDWSQHDFAPRHGFHQHERKTLAAAG